MSSELGPLNPVLHQQLRLAIVSTLIRLDSAGFNYLKEVTNASKGNLSRQLTNLKNEGYISVKKSFVGNYPCTTCKITKKGIEALEQYTEQLKNYLDLNLNNK
ncbi:transcriptional regulator [bacterium]|nr:transcriptional regulator [bacterium]